MPDFSPVQLEQFVRDRAPQIAQDIRTAAQKARNEADLVAEVENLLDRFSRSFDIQLNLERERTLINGRADAVYNRLVIEYEPPHSLTKSNIHRNNKHAIKQVQNYMAGLERLDRHRKERLAGVVLDGNFFIFVRFRDDRWFIDDPLPINPHSTETFLRYLLSLSTEKALTPENLVRDFGENSNVARQVVPALYQIICCSDIPKVNVIFKQWELQFREISGYDPDGGQLDARDLGRLYAVKDKHPDLEKLFFAVHTYYAAFIKLLAIQVVHYYLMPKTGSGLKAVAGYDINMLHRFLQKMEAGGLFKELGFRNFLEGDFFGWYLDSWDMSIYSAVQKLVRELADYSMVTLDVDPEETRDLLKQLYQNLMPKKLRHALGEYYTPDWLAERLLKQLGYDGNPAKRILDPACGSGTFPVLEIKMARKYIDEKMLPPAQALDGILENIVGYDLNPLAVITARTNYLLALGDLLEYRNGEITIPIYLSDSILTPSKGNDLFNLDAYSFSTSVGRFSIPKSLVQAHLIDRLANLLEECVHLQVKLEVFRERFVNEFPSCGKDNEREVGIAVNLFSQLLELEQKGVNGIWARIIKNAFAPLFQGKFDYVAGNPPWVTWQNLPADYREASIYLWEYYKLFESEKVMKRQISSRVQVDISVLLFFVSKDRYLVNKGKLGFIITQSIFQSVIAGRGFRKLMLPDGRYISVLHVDDFTDMQPFEGATNLTSVLVSQLSSKTNYPIPYTVWRKREIGWQPPTEASLEEIIERTRRVRFVARPIDEGDDLSAWLTGKEKALEHISRCIGRSYYYEFARKGSDTRGANGIYWVEEIIRRPDGLLVVRNMSEAGRKNIEDIQVAVEPKFVYPLLRGRDVRRWQSKPAAFIVLPYDEQNSSQPVTEDALCIYWPNTYQYLKHFEQDLRRRPTFRNFDPSTGNFYQLYNVGEYSFSNFKVVWREQSSRLTAAVVTPIDDTKVIPDHKLSLVPVNIEEEAYFLCGLINSSISQFIVKSYSLGTSTDVHVLNYINCPPYSPEENVHKQLSHYSKCAHVAAAMMNKEEITIYENYIDKLAAKVWGLSEDELKEIQESLLELR